MLCDTPSIQARKQLVLEKEGHIAAGINGFFLPQHIAISTTIPCCRGSSTLTRRTQSINFTLL